MNKELPTTIHGTGLVIYNKGVLILGNSGIGKSEIALELVSIGHNFIADDSIEISTEKKQLIMNSTNSALHIRGLGFLNPCNIYNVKQIKTHKIDLIIKLVDDIKLNSINPLEKLYKEIEFNNVKIYQFIVPVNKYRNTARIIETIVKCIDNIKKNKNFFNLDNVINHANYNN